LLPDEHSQCGIMFLGKAVVHAAFPFPFCG
jgi:hypothetical protein